jgi:hypothetical protein
MKTINTERSRLNNLRSRKSTMGLKIKDTKMETASIARISANKIERNTRRQIESKIKKYLLLFFS